MTSTIWALPAIGLMNVVGLYLQFYFFRRLRYRDATAVAAIHNPPPFNQQPFWVGRTVTCAKCGAKTTWKEEDKVHVFLEVEGPIADGTCPVCGGMICAIP